MKDADLNKIGRNFLRILGMGVIFFYCVFRIAIPLVTKEPIYLDKNDGYVMLVAFSVVLCVEAVRAYLKSKINFDDNDTPNG